MVNSRDRAHALALLDVSRETIELLDLYVALLYRWNKSINLVSPQTLGEVWTRHVLDCGQLVKLCPAQAVRWADLGSGAGLPGLVVAIMMTNRIGFEMNLIDSDQRKSAFQRTAIRELGLAGRVFAHADRIDRALDRLGPVDVVSARALAPLRELSSMTESAVDRGAVGLFLKGENVRSELTDWGPPDKFEVKLAPSQTHPAAAIVVVRKRAH